MTENAATIIKLSPEVVALWQACEALRLSYAASGLTFTPDGKLVGDIAEAAAQQAFKLTWCMPQQKGIDAKAPDHRTVQIKSTGKSNRGPAFGPGPENAKADHLIFLRINFADGLAEVVYNGSEARVREVLGTHHKTTKTISLKTIRNLDTKVPNGERLKNFA